MKEPEDVLVVAILDRLLTDCDASSYERLISGLENTGAQTGMYDKQGWDVYTLNQKMLYMLSIDSRATAEKMETSSFARWVEGHKKFMGILGDVVTEVAYGAVLYRCQTAKAVSKPKGEGGLEPGTLSNVDARKWYLEQEAKIPDLIDDSLPLEQQARQAFELRNQYRMQARELMSDRQLAESLYATDPNLTWEQIIQKQIDKGLSGDDIYKAIIESSQRSRTSVNQSLGLE